MLQDFTNFLRGECAVDPAQPLLLACSGGMDSMVLAHLLKQIGQPFAIAHVNFQLRGEASDADEQLVVQWAKDHEVDVHVKRFDTKNIKAEQGGSTQMVARDLRYEWFLDLRTEHAYSFLATAHHLDDSIETFLINLSRTTGLAGLTGIAPNENNIVRPLLPFTKAQLENFAWQNEIGWREDESNEGDDYLRNRVRHQIVPLFMQENSAWKSGMAQSMHYLSQAERSLENYFNGIMSDLGFFSGKINIQDLLCVQPLGIFLYHCFAGLGFTSSQLREIEQALRSPEQKNWHAGTYRILISQGYLLWDLSTSKVGEAVIENYTELAGKLGISYRFIEYINYEELITEAAKAGSNAAYLDADLLDFPFTAAPVKNGEGFYPIGRGGYKLISDYFNEQKMNKLEREQQIILRSAKNDIIWVIGKRLDNRFKITPTTKRVVVLSID